MNSPQKHPFPAVEKPTEKKKSAVDWSSVDTQFEFHGRKIVLPGEPESMSYEAALATIERQRDYEDQRFDVRELVAGAPWDALVAINKAMKAIYGVVIAQSIQSFFGEIKPELITIKVGPLPEDNIQVVTGKMSLPNVEDPVFVQLHRSGAFIQGTVKRRQRSILVEIANKAREIMQTDSIYRGKAITLEVDDDGDLNLLVQPSFQDLRKVKETDIIHTETTAKLIETNIFAPLKHTQACRDLKIPLKRGILLEGRYGTGKTLTAKVTAKIATDHNWTFIHLLKAQGLRAAIDFAKTYQPCVIFAEDIDRAGADRDNDEEVNELVNMLDGLITKDMEMEVVLTTNFIERIDTALLRPGRFDAIIRIEPPNAETAVRLIYMYAQNLIPPMVNLTVPVHFSDGQTYVLGEVLANQIPATIREVVERAKLTMLMQERNTLTTEDLVISAVGMKQHMALLEPKDEKRTPAELFYEAFTKMVTDAANIDYDVAEGLKLSMERVVSSHGKLAKVVSDKLDKTNTFSQMAADSAMAAKERADIAIDISKKDLVTTERVLKAIS